MAHEATTTTHTTNKRKRGNMDTDPTRPAPNYARTAGATDENMEPYPVDDGGISQLIAHNNQDVHPNGGQPTGPADTAAAALSHYQMGAVDNNSFQTQGSAADASFSLDSQSFAVDQLKDSAGQGGPTQQSPTGAGGSKPPVGSEEWHKVRRDNHKEGMICCLIHRCVALADILKKLNVVVARLSTRASTNSKRSSRVARRTKDLSSNAPFNTSPSSKTMKAKTSRNGPWRSFYSIKQSTN